MSNWLNFQSWNIIIWDNIWWIPVTNWLSWITYNISDIIIENDKIYECIIKHTSDVFLTDLSNWYWKEISADTTDLSWYQQLLEKWQADWYASLDWLWKIPSDQLPSYVDDVLEFPTLLDFPATGETWKIYIAIATNKQYRWSGSAYFEIIWWNPFNQTLNTSDSPEFTDVNITWLSEDNWLSNTTKSVLSFLDKSWLYIKQFLIDKQENWIPESEKTKFTELYDSTTRILTLTKISDWHYYVNWKKFTITWNVVFPAHTNSNWNYFFYFDSNWTATTSSTPWDVLTTAQCKMVPYNINNDWTWNPFWLPLYEFHGVNMSSASHKYLHLTQWTKVSWLTISWLTTAQTLAWISPAIWSWTLRDEDIELPISAITDWWPYEMVYFSSTWVPNFRTVSNAPMFISGSNNAQYNPIWSWLTDITQDRFFNIFLVAINAWSNNITKRLLFIPWNTLFTTSNSAQAEILNLQWLNTPEAVIVSRITYEYQTWFATITWKTRWNSTTYVWLNQVSLTWTLTDHQLLTNRSALYTHPSSSISDPTYWNVESAMLSKSWWNTTDNIWYLNIPQNTQSANYTTVLTDSWKKIYHPVWDNNARVFTIDSNANVAYPIWTVIMFQNQSATSLSIAITSDTLRLDWTWATWTRTLAQFWKATAIKDTATEWTISWINLT